jgi:hypothetical protein
MALWSVLGSLVLMASAITVGAASYREASHAVILWGWSIAGGWSSVEINGKRP